MGAGKKKSQATEAAELRRRAEELVMGVEPPGAEQDRSNDEPMKLVHELRVYQIELEMQNAELRRARDEVEAALERYTELYDFAPVGYFTFDAGGVIREVNLAGAHLLGIERQLLINRHFTGFIADAAGRETFSRHLDLVLQRQVMLKCEMYFRGKGGDAIYGHLQSTAVTGGNRAGCILTSIVDGTIRKQLEVKLENLHADLEAHAAELTEANIDLEAFNFAVSHDLRRPLTAIHAYCQVLQELCGNQLDEQSKDYVREIFDGTLRMNRLIKVLLDFSHVKRNDLRRETVDLSAMVKAVAAEIQLAEPERRVVLKIAEGVMVKGDAALCRIVIDNLINNAWKYSANADEAVIEFGMTRVDGKPACFVRDNGPGFDMAHADKLFVPFQRIPGTAVAGHGIGLATVDRIVRRHGGKVWAESEPGNGATFFFTLE